MYEDVIEKINKEIEEKQSLIEKIKEFNQLSLSDKIQTVKKCDLRYDREVMSKIIHSEFKSDLLRCGEASIGVNYFTIKNEGFTFNVGLFNGKIIEIITDKKESIINIDLINIYNLKIDECKKAIDNLIAFKNKPTFSKYKKLSKRICSNKNLFKYILLIIQFKRLIAEYTDELDKHLTDLTIELKFHKAELSYNNELKEKKEKYLKDIKIDLDYFTKNDYLISIKF